MRIATEETAWQPSGMPTLKVRGLLTITISCSSSCALISPALYPQSRAFRRPGFQAYFRASLRRQRGAALPHPLCLAQCLAAPTNSKFQKTGKTVRPHTRPCPSKLAAVDTECELQQPTLHDDWPPLQELHASQVRRRRQTHRLFMSTSAFLQTTLEKRRPIPRIAVMAYITFSLPSTLVLSTRRMCWNSSPAMRDCAGRQKALMTAPATLPGKRCESDCSKCAADSTASASAGASTRAVEDTQPTPRKCACRCTSSTDLAALAAAACNFRHSHYAGQASRAPRAQQSVSRFVSLLTDT